VLGAFGKPEVTGKPVGDDLREGKPTPMLALAVARASGADARLLERVGAPDLTGHEVVALQEVLVSTGALEQLEESISALAEEAIAAIEVAPVTSAARVALVELAQYAAWRDR
jgi:geranylgeranyl diphosphate synthase type I